jgi:hypothetical protein
MTIRPKTRCAATLTGPRTRSPAGTRRAVGPRSTRSPVGPGRAGRSRYQSSGRHNQKRLFHVISFSRLPMTQAAARGRACLS